MPNPKLKKTDIIIITTLFILYMVGYAYLIEPKKETVREVEKPAKQLTQEVGQAKADEKQQVESLNDWPLDLGKYYCTIDIAPGYEMEEEEFEVVGESGGKLIVKRHNDWPEISGHFEWYCNEKLTTTQQMFDYVIAHHNAIVKQMQEIKRSGIESVK